MAHHSTSCLDCVDGEAHSKAVFIRHNNRLTQFKIQRAMEAGAESVSSSSDGTGSSASEELFVCTSCEGEYTAQQNTKEEEKAGQRKRRIERRKRMDAFKLRTEEEEEASWNAPRTRAQHLVDRKLDEERKKRTEARGHFVQRKRAEEAAIPAARRQQMLQEWWDGGDSVPFPFNNFYDPALLKNYPTE